MGLPQLVARLEQEADARIAAIEEATRLELERLAQERDRQTSAARELELHRLQAGWRARLGREEAQARSEASSTRLQAERAFTERVLARVGSLLALAPDDEAYLAVLEAQTREALRFVGDQPVSLRCLPALAVRLRGLLAGAAGLSVVADPACPPGLRLLANDGSVEVDDTLATRLQRLAPDLGPMFLRGAAP